MNAQFKRGIVELCVLSELVQEDMYGYSIISNISEHIDVNENTVYPILRRLTKQGLFDTYTETMSIGAPRKYYKITGEGTEKLNEYESEWKKFIDSVYRILGGASNEK